LFEAQAARTPTAAAVEFGNQALSYQDLNQRANQLAHYLRERGAGPDVLVGLCVERSLEMAIGILGILKAGSAYVPIDPAYPAERLRYMFEDSQVSLLLTQESLLGRLPEHAAHVICLKSEWDRIAQQTTANPASNGTPADLAYVLYTSG